MDITPVRPPPEVTAMEAIVSAAPQPVGADSSARTIVAAVIDDTRDRFSRTAEATKASDLLKRLADAEQALVAADAAVVNHETAWRAAVESGKDCEAAENALLTSRQKRELVRSRVELLRPLAKTAEGERLAAFRRFRGEALSKALHDAQQKFRGDAVAMYPKVAKLLGDLKIAAMVIGSLQELRALPAAIAADGPRLLPKEAVA